MPGFRLHFDVGYARLRATIALFFLGSRTFCLTGLAVSMLTPLFLIGQQKSRFLGLLPSHRRRLK
jgi:hypothetical protein